MTVVCGDSHTATHGAFGALAFGIGTSEVEHVLATQCLLQRPSKTFAVRVDGRLRPGVTAKDIILALIARIGIGGGTGCRCSNTAAPTIRALSMEERMTVCNMSIEGGARAGLIAPDDTTYQYLAGRAFAPKGAHWDAAVARWRKLPTDDGAVYDREISIDAHALEPMITFGTNPGMGIPIDGRGADPADIADPMERETLAKALRYMDLPAGKPLLGHPVNVVFIGSCTNSRISDLRAAAALLKGRKVSPNVRVMVVPGSQQVKAQARGRGSRPGVPRCRGRLPRSRLLDVHRDEWRSVAARRVQRLHQQSQLRRTARQGRAHVPGESVDRGGQRHYRRGYRREDTFVKFESQRPWFFPVDNIDTDQIIPARFLKTISKEGLDDAAFL